MAELDVDDVAVLIPCTYCDAGSGEWCVTKADNPSTWLHNARRRPVEAIRSQGWRDGRTAGRNNGAVVMDRILFGPVTDAKHDSISRSWLVAAFYKVRRELVP